MPPFRKRAAAATISSTCTMLHRRRRGVVVVSGRRREGRGHAAELEVQCSVSRRPATNKKRCLCSGIARTGGSSSAADWPPFPGADHGAEVGCNGVVEGRGLEAHAITPGAVRGSRWRRPLDGPLASGRSSRRGPGLVTMLLLAGAFLHRRAARLPTRTAVIVGKTDRLRGGSL